MAKCALTFGKKDYGQAQTVLRNAWSTEFAAQKLSYLAPVVLEAAFFMLGNFVALVL